MRKISFFLSLVAGIVVGCAHAAHRDWTVLIYMNPTHEYSDMAIKNINDALSARVGENVTVLLQLHAYGTTALRYEVKPGLLIQEHTVSLTGGKQDLIDFCSWGFAKAPAEHYMFILWGSGFGVLDPIWDDEDQLWEPEPDDMSMPVAACELTVGVEKRYRSIKQQFKGILLSKEPRSYLSNSEFVEALRGIHELLHKKIDILGLDMCLGGMLEHAYQAAPYADFLIGSQNCELKDGWDYQALGAIFAKAHTAQEVATGIINAFETYYEPRAAQGNYTQVAIDLSYATQLKEGIDRVVQFGKECNKRYGQPLKDALRRARKQSTRFCFMPMYTDIVTLCSKFQQELRVLPPSPTLQLLSDELEHLCFVVQQAVKANCTGYAMKGLANGISIYFPFVHIDSSYDNQFSRDSRWLELLRYSLA